MFHVYIYILASTILYCCLTSLCVHIHSLYTIDIFVALKSIPTNYALIFDGIVCVYIHTPAH